MINSISDFSFKFNSPVKFNFDGGDLNIRFRCPSDRRIYVCNRYKKTVSDIQDQRFYG